MAELVDRLRKALADRYLIERELGRGGMAIVYLAEDRRHQRRVALKVLRPELAASIGAERFLREITTAAQLTHPHILPLFDSGEVSTSNASNASAVFLYYTMPYVEGESLRDRLNREKQLPIEDALQITREVADALGYAHEQGIVHRDIKPENILFQRGHALVADFGIARAVSAAGVKTLTETGLAVGTPAYMSPEQAMGTKDIDARTDIYSLGCVLYEMLSGDAPYTASTPQAVIAKKLSEPLPRVSVVREMVPPPVEAALAKAMARTPADRFATAAQFTAALLVDTAACGRRERMRRLARRAAIGIVALLVAVMGTFGATKFWAARGWTGRGLDPNVIAVMPFVVRAADPSLDYLDEGVVELFYNTVYSGELGIRAVNPAVLLTAVKRQESGGVLDQARSLQLSAQFGAGRMLQGAVVQDAGEITIRGSLSDVPSGELIAEDTVSGDPDYAHDLVFRLTAKLIGTELGERAESRQSFAQYDPAAVQAYLLGARAYNRGDYREAVSHFDRAVNVDTMFALAALRAALAQTPAMDDIALFLRRLGQATALQEALNPRDRAGLAALRAVYDPEFDGDPLLTSRAWVSSAPDDPNALLRLVRALRRGPLLPDNWRQEARQALDSAWALDSATPGILGVHMWTALQTGDVEWVRRIADQYAAVVDTTADWSVAHRWGIALARGDSGALEGFRMAALDGDPRIASVQTAHGLTTFSLLAGVPLDDAELAADQAMHNASTRNDSVIIGGSRTAIAVARGRLIDAAVGDARWVPGLSPAGELIRIIDLWRLYPGLDSAAARAATSLTRMLSAGPLEDLDRGYRERDDLTRLSAACRLELYRWVTTDSTGILERLASIADHPWIPHCPLYVEALMEADGGAPLGSSAVDSLTTMVREVPGFYITDLWARLLVRLRRYRGELQQGWGLQAASTPSFMTVAAHAKDEGDLAALVGDTARAIEAYSRYLTFRTDPDAGPVRAEVDSVREALAALMRARG